MGNIEQQKNMHHIHNPWKYIHNLLKLRLVQFTFFFYYISILKFYDIYIDKFCDVSITKFCDFSIDNNFLTP